MVMAANQQTVEFAYMMGRMLVYIIPMLILIYLIRKSIQLYAKYRIERKKAERAAEERQMYQMDEAHERAEKAALGMDDLNIPDDTQNAQ